MDFYCPRKKLAIELDGAVHSNPLRSEYDAMRESYIRSEGIRLLRFENRLVFEEIEYVLGTIQAALSD